MQTLKIKDIGKIVSGSTPKTDKEEYWNGNIPWITPKEMGQLTSQYLFTTERKITQLGFKSCSTTIIPKNNVLFTSRAPIGLVAVNKIDVCTNQGFKSIILNDGFDALYVYYYLKSKKEQLNNLGSGTTFKELSKRTFEKFEIPAPEYMDQIRIATLLGKTEALITQRKECLHLLDKYIKSKFLEMFGDPVSNKKGWEKVPIRKLGQVITGNTPPRGDLSNFSNNYIEWIKTDNIIIEELFITKANEYLSENGLKKSRFVDKGALLVACIAGSIESVGRAGLTNRRVAFNQQINAIQPHEDINSLFLYYLFKNSKAYIQNHATKGMKRILTKGVFEKIQMIRPPVALQNEFASIVEKTETLRKQYQRSLQEFEKLFISLSQLAFKGELDLSRIKSKSIDEEIERIVLGNKQTKPVETKPKKETEEYTRYEDPFDTDEATAKKQGAWFYNEWLRIHGKTAEQKQGSVWLQSRKNGKNVVSLKFSEAEGNAIIEEVFAKQNMGFSYQEFEAFIKNEKFIHTAKELKEFIFRKMEQKELVQHFASKEWVEAIRNPKFNPPGGSDFIENGSIWFLASKTKNER